MKEVNVDVAAQSLSVLLGQIAEGQAFDPHRLLFVSTPSAIVSSVSANSMSGGNQEGKVGEAPATVIGINCSGTVEETRLAASDSFGPCVPVVSFHGGVCYFAHCQSPMLVMGEYGNLVASKGGAAIVFAKLKTQDHVGRAKFYCEQLEKKKIETTLAVLPCEGRIGVVACAATRTVLVYSQV